MNFGEHILIAKEAREAGATLRNYPGLQTANSRVKPGTMKAQGLMQGWLAEWARRNLETNR